MINLSSQVLAVPEIVQMKYERVYLLSVWAPPGFFPQRSYCCPFTTVLIKKGWL